MKKVLIIRGSDMYYTGDGREGISGEERLAERVEEFINTHEVLDVHYSQSYHEGISVNVNYSVMIIYTEKTND